MKNLFIAIISTLIAATAIAQEADCIEVENITISPGEEVELGISLINQAEIYEALQCNIALPKGLEFVQAYGTARRPSYIELTDRCEDMDITVCNIASYGELAGTLAVALTTDPGLSIYGNNGAIFHITVKANESLQLNSEIIVKNIVLTETGYVSHYLDNASGTVTRPIEEGYYLVGSWNDWSSDDAVAFTEVSDGKWVATATLNAGDEFKIIGTDNVMYGGDTDGSDSPYVLTPDWSSAPLLAGDGGVNFRIDINGNYTFTMQGSNLTVTGWPTGVTLDEALAGVGGLISEELVVAYKTDRRLYTTNGTRWLRIDGVNTDAVEAGHLIAGYQLDASNIKNTGTAPVIEVTSLRTMQGSNLPTFNEHDLARSFVPMPIAGEIIKIKGYYNIVNEIPQLSGYSGLNGSIGQSVVINNPEDMEERTQYLALAVVELKEAWDDGEAGAPRHIKKNADEAYRNVTITILERPLATGIETPMADVPFNVTYVNYAGQVSDCPFDGINIVVTTYENGIITVEKSAR